MNVEPIKRKGSLFVRNMDMDIKDHFKAWCAKRGITMTKAIERFMLSCIKEQLKEEEEKL